MDAQELRNLQEAYRQVHQPQEEVEQLDEGKSSRPRYPGGRGVLDQETRDEKREAHAENRKGHTFGPGTVTKNPKKLRKQKAMGELGENFDLFDYLLEYLVAEGYADTNEAALAIMANMSEEWRQSIVESSEEDIRRSLDYEDRYHQKKGGKPDPFRRELQNLRLQKPQRRRPPA